MKMICHSCGREVEVVERVGFRQTCQACSAWLHSCVHCRFWSGSSCSEPSADRVNDPEAQNFCEWYREKAEGGGQSADRSGDRTSAEEIWRTLVKKGEEGRREEE
jgi:hypothetical protein